ncbi:MAG TPA: hypothetical protein VFW31_02000, partial [Candidatus Angelobacter sp.]|nr:hypothetical protein [Candidatus Angelobacter sp.]
TMPGEYKLADRAYARLLKDLARKDFAGASPALRQNILSFYSDLNRPFETKRHKNDWKRVLANLNELKHQPQSAQVVDVQ